MCGAGLAILRVCMRDIRGRWAKHSTQEWESARLLRIARPSNVFTCDPLANVGARCTRLTADMGKARRCIHGEGHCGHGKGGGMGVTGVCGCVSRPLGVCVCVRVRVCVCVCMCCAGP